MAEPETITQPRTKTSLESSWNVLVHDDPVNLMGYVTHVLMKVFGYPENRAVQLMMEVHQSGRSIVWSGGREKAEFYVQQLQSHQLQSSLEKSGVNIIPTLQGGLRIEIEDAADWLLLGSIPNDACDRDQSLGCQLSDRIEDPDIHSDWRDFVTPELDSQFSEALQHIANRLSEAKDTHHGGSGAVWITPQDGDQWYSALNQARLALEDRFHFGSQNQIETDKLAPTSRSAFLRSQLYLAIQSLLLEHVLQ